MDKEKTCTHCAGTGDEYRLALVSMGLMIPCSECDGKGFLKEEEEKE